MEDIIRDPDDPDDPDAWMWLFEDEADEDASRDATKKAQKWFFFFLPFCDSSLIMPFLSPHKDDHDSCFCARRVGVAVLVKRAFV